VTVAARWRRGALFLDGGGLQPPQTKDSAPMLDWMHRGELATMLKGPLGITGLGRGADRAVRVCDRLRPVAPAAAGDQRELAAVS
jgi:hypothetical protein